jgi:LacI family transcriptional regulator
MIGLGHRRIGFIGSAVATSVSTERYSGYCDALSAFGLVLDPALIATCRPAFGDAADATRNLLARSPAPTALVCFNDIIAFGATLALYEQGLEPGPDVSIIGFDDIEWAASWRPALTTMAIAPKQVGHEAGRLLLQRIGKEAEAPQSVLSEATLVVRKTCAAPRRPPSKS